MMKYTIEQLKEYCKDKDITQKIACPICGKLYVYRGLWVHIDRSHNESKQYCQGNNGCYKSEKYKTAIKTGMNNYYNEVLGDFKEFEVESCKCHKIFTVTERENKFPSKDKYFCSVKCSHSHIISDEQKKKASEWNKIHNRKHPEHNICRWCGEKTKSWKNKFCSKDCLRNWKRGNQTEIKKYRTDCQFTFSLNQFPEEFDFTLVEKYGWYKATNHGNNLTGVSRDHMYSIHDGFVNKVDPKIISHPANCKLMQHTSNSAKHSKSSITLDELLKRIEEWDNKYGVWGC